MNRISRRVLPQLALALAAAGMVMVPGVAATAAEVAGVQFPEQKTVEGKQLKLNGAGVRTRMVRLYAGGLYAENPTSNAQEFVNSNQVKHMELHMLRGLSQKQVTDAIVDGFKKNSGPQMPELQARLDKLTSALPALKKGEVLGVTYVPDKGVTVSAPGIQPVTLQGEDFSRALFNVWLGNNPVDKGFKQGLMRGGKAAGGT